MAAAPREMRMSIAELMREENWSTYRVELDDESIYVAVTHNPDTVRFWISTVIVPTYNLGTNRIVVGVRVEWTRSSNRWWGKCREVDILQLCVGQHCLIFQMRRANGNIPQQLLQFLGDFRFIFVGVGMKSFIEVLNRDYGIRFRKGILDLNRMYKNWLLKNNIFNIELHNTNFGLRELNNFVLRTDYDRPMEVVTSNWDALVLEQGQILYASADAYSCFRIGMVLRAWDFKFFVNASTRI